MARFVYTAEKSDGEVYRGVAEARDRFELYGIVRGEGGRVISLDEDAKSVMLNLEYWNVKLSRVKDYDKILFARNLGAMLGAGLSLTRALAVLERQTKNPKLSSLIAQISSDVRRGETLHAALGKHTDVFSSLFIAMVRAGEEGGDLSQTLLLIADQTERMYLLKKKIRGALIYPAIIVTAILGIGVFMMTNVVPTLAQTFKDMHAQLPATTQFVIAISDFLTKYTLIAVGGAVALIALIAIMLRTRPGRRASDFVTLHMPLIGSLSRQVNAARMSRTLASLLSAGVDVISALRISGDVVQNSYFRGVIETAEKAVAAGEPLSAAFVRREDLYPAFVGEMMSVGEETGQIAEMMKRLALYYEEEVDRATNDLSTVIEPFLMLAIGAAVGFFAVSMISPIYSLSSSIN